MKARLRLLPLLLATLVMAAAQPAQAFLVYATNGTSIAQFDTASPGVTSSVPVTGLQGGETLVGIDVRPATQMLYGIGSLNRIYTINPATGVATAVGNPGQFTLSGTSFGVDFNPVVDRIRVVSNANQNLRLNPNDGTLAGTDTALTGATTIAAAAYSNSFAGATLTTLYAIDAGAGTLVTIGGINGSPSPNGGVVSTIGSLGLGTNLDPRIGFDISSASNMAFATILTGGTDKLYSINLTTGASTLVGQIGTGAVVYNGFTAASAIPEPSTYALMAAAAVLFLVAKGYRRAKV